MPDLRHNDSIDSQAEARDQEIIGKDDRVTRLKFPGSERHPGGLNISLSSPLSHLETTLVTCQAAPGDDDMLLLIAVVSRAHPGGSEMMRMPSLGTEGISKQDFKAGDVSVPASGDQGNGDEGVILLLSDGDGDQGPQDDPMSVSGGHQAPSGRSPANGRALGSSPAAPPLTPKMSTPSMPEAVPKGTRRPTTIATGKHGDDRSPGISAKQSLRRPTRRKTTPVKCDKDAARNDRLHLSSVVSRAHPGGSEMRLPSLRREGISQQQVKGEYVPVARLSASGDSDSEDIEPQQDPDPDHELEDSEEEEEDDTLQPFPSRGTRGTSVNRRSSEHGRTPRGIHPAAAPPPTLEASSSSLLTAVLEGVRKAATRRTGKRKQPDDEEEECPTSSAGREHLTRAADRKQLMTNTDLRLNEDSQRQQENFTFDIGGAKSRCECRSNRAAFGLPGAGGRKTARWCSQCPSKPDNAVDMRSKPRCECGSHLPSFGLPGGSGSRKDARWCSQCPSKPNNAVDVKHKRCECGRHYPAFGLPGAGGTKDARWCSQCPSKPNNAVDVLSKRCECGSHGPTFGLPGASGKKDARWCSQCPSKPKNAVNVRRKQCECGSHLPSFGLPGGIGQKDARWCSQCPSKPNNAVDVRSKQCECGSHGPTFGLPGTSGKKAARWCSQCPSKPNNAVDVVTKKCECGSRQPTFGLPGAGGRKAAKWCSQCPSKPSNAVNVRHSKGNACNDS